jgi:hypothetical protein
LVLPSNLTDGFLKLLVAPKKMHDYIARSAKDTCECGDTDDSEP